VGQVEQPLVAQLPFVDGFAHQVFVDAPRDEGHNGEGQDQVCVAAHLD
jgi:hypothetical protein